jgi:hypothetical protein
MASLQEVLDFHLHFLNSSKIFLKINPAWIFFLLLQWKSPFESANISDHSTRNLNRDIFFFITYSTLQRKFERSIDYRFVSNWKEKEKKRLMELTDLFMRSKLENLTFYWRVPRTTKCAGLLSKVPNLPFFNA